MPIRIGKKSYKDWKAAAASIQRKNPSYPKSEVNAVVAIIEKRHKAKLKRKKRKKKTK